MVWCVVVWCGVVWCDVVWCGVVRWCGVVIACPWSVASVHPACMGGGSRARIAGERLEARPSVTSYAGRGLV